MDAARPGLIGGGRTAHAYRNALERAEAQRDALSKEQAELVTQLEAAEKRLAQAEAILRDLRERDAVLGGDGIRLRISDFLAGTRRSSPLRDEGEK